MPRKLRSSILETRTARLKLPVRKKSHGATSVSRGVTLSYRRCQGPGRWCVRVVSGGADWARTFGTADDIEPANGETILDFYQAVDRARLLARGSDADTGRPATVAEAVAEYEKDLRARGGDPVNASRLLTHLTPTLLSKPVSMLTARELKSWRDDLLADGNKPATVLRNIKTLKATLNLASRNDARITNKAAWSSGLSGIAETHGTRGAVFILDTEKLRAVVAAGYEVDPAFGLFNETMATTGSRQSQLARLAVGDLQQDRLLMPPSRKGSRRKSSPVSVPIPPGLAAKLRNSAGKRTATEPLLLKSDGTPWHSERNDEHLAPWRAAAARAGLDPKISQYCLRHTSIVRQLLAGTPVRLVASLHDTSVVELERTYAKWISHSGDEIARRGLIDFAQPAAADNVVTIGRR